MIRVAIAEDSLLVREGLERLLERDPGVEVVGSCGDLAALEELVASQEPDVLVTDVRMPPGFSDEGIRAAVGFRATRPAMGVVVLSQYAEPAYATALLAGGSAGRAYLLKERVSEPGQLAEAVKAVAAGGSVVDPHVVEALVTPQQSSPIGSLTPREVEVLDQVAQGKSNAAVAAALFLSERAVEKHINALFPKLGLLPTPDVNRRVAAVLLHLSERGR
ncbi:response regulator transcription factor [Nocardioides maradonensis]